MSRIRMVVRLILAVIVTFGAWFSLVLGHLPASLLGPSALAHWRAAHMRAWSRLLARVVGMRIHVEGTPPEGFLVANHLSYMDILVLGAVTGTGFVSKAEVAGWPGIGICARSAGTLFLNRERKRELVPMAAEIRERLAHGQGLCVFPEGTSTRGAEILPFRSSLLEPAAEGRIPVSYAALRYATPPGSPPADLSVCWWGEMTLGPHLLRLLSMPGFDATVAFGPEPIADPDRKALAARLHRAASGLFRPTTAPDL